jgi:hypothetical protein
MNTNIKTFIITLIWLFASFGAFAQVRYVTQSGSGSKDGSSWANASDDLQAMINTANAGDQIFVAAGIYKPARTADGWLSANGAANNTLADGARDNAFVLNPGVKIYGGFSASVPESLVSERAVNIVDGIRQMVNTTTLSGDIGQPDDASDNTYHVVIGAGNLINNNDTARLDGFTVTGGYSTNSNSASITVNGINSIRQSHGGGISLWDNASPVLTNLVITGNEAERGGGIYNDGAAPVLTHTVISGNTASGDGGGIYNVRDAAPVLTHVVLSGNRAGNEGGGMCHTASTATLTNVLITGNKAEYLGGGIFGNNSSPFLYLTLTNVTVAGNRSSTAGFDGTGGGIYRTGHGAVEARNSIFYGNSAGNDEALNNNTVFFYYCLVEGLTPDGTDVVSDAAPLFVAPRPAAEAPSVAGDYRLTVCSPAIDMGNNAFYAPGETPELSAVITDLDGNPRFNGVVDLGAYEYNGTRSIAQDTDIALNDTSLCYGTTATLWPTAAATITDPNFKWYSSQTATMPFHTGASYTTSALTADTTFYISVEGSNACENEQGSRKEVRVIVMPPLTGGSIAESQVILYGETPASLTQTVVPTGGSGTYAYLWEENSNNGGWNEISGATGTEYSPSAATAFVRYRRKLTDSLCGSVYSDTVTILPLKPLSRQYIACPESIVTIGFTNTGIAGLQFLWYNAPTGGSPIESTASNTLTRTKDDNQTQTFWAEPIIGTDTFARYRVDILKSQYCSALNAAGCSDVSATLYKEDFGGNNTGDPDYAPQGLDAGLIDLSFCPSGTCTNGYYFAKTITKSNYAPFVAVGRGDDHTFWNDKKRGYFMYIDPPASSMNAKVYGSKINGLCAGANLNFTLWAADLYSSNTATEVRPKVEMIIRDAFSGDTIVTSGIITLFREHSKQPKLVWRQYGFDFTIPSGVDSILFTILNKETSGTGNDWFLDDIEVHFCVPAVSITHPLRSDTVVCQGQPLTLEGTYTDNGSFTGLGDHLVARWEYSTTGEQNYRSAWTPIAGSESSVASTSITSAFPIASALSADEGYYRLVVANASSINSANCRAISRVIRVRVAGNVVPGHVSADQTVCYGDTPDSLRSTPASRGTTDSTYTYQWLQSIDGSHWENAAGNATEATYGFSAMYQTTHYQLKTIGGSAVCDTAYSNVVTITVSTVTAPAIQVSAEPCHELFFSVPALYRGYQWRIDNSSGSTVGTTPYIAVSDVGTHTRVVRVENEAGCWSDDSAPTTGEVVAPSTPPSALVTTFEPNYDVSPPTVTFSVSWAAASRNCRHRDSVWVFVDYLPTGGGSWRRAPIAATPSSVSSDGGGVALADGSDRGFWLYSDGGAGSYSATLTVALNVPSSPRFSWCAYVSDYPPNTTERDGFYELHGTAPFAVDGTPLPAGQRTFDGCISTSLTDSTGCPGWLPLAPTITSFGVDASQPPPGGGVLLRVVATHAAYFSFDNGATWSPRPTHVLPSTPASYTVHVKSLAGCLKTANL